MTMKKLFLFTLALLVIGAATFALAGGKSATMKGWVSDERCGAKGAGAGHEGCAKKCIEGGQKAVFVTEDDKKVIAVANPEAVKGHEGHHVEVTGSVGDDGALHVDNVKMLAQAAKSDEKGDMHKE